MLNVGPIGSYLAKLGLIDPDGVELFHVGTRDDLMLEVYRDTSSGLFFLSDIAKKPQPYSNRPIPEKQAFTPDNRRRDKLLAPILKDAVWAEVGSGGCGLVYHTMQHTKRTYAVEPDYNFHGIVRNVKFYKSAGDLPGDVEVATLFHVLEHMETPLEELKQLRMKMRSGGKLVIEVPHARDLLIEISHSFRQHTFWSEHLVLYTQETLKKLLHLAGFKEIVTWGVQRYPVSNHYKWLIKDNVQGGFDPKEMDTPDLNKAYAERLKEIDRTDTIMATAEV